MGITLRPYQNDIADQAVHLLALHGMVYICAEVRTGKTLMALEAAHLYGYKKVLFLTKLKAISSIQKDYESGGYTFPITIINNESLHKVPDSDFDLIIIDEAHRIGMGFPKPSKLCKDLRARFYEKDFIFLSGTPTPETYSQIFHQFFITKHSPFKEKSFYQWAKTYTTPTVKRLGHYTVNDYSKAIQEKITPMIEPFFIRFTQKDAGFHTEVTEHVLYCRMHPSTYTLTKKLRRDKIIEGSSDVILADTGAKMMSKIHQIFSGTCILESGSAVTLDESKAVFIREHFKGKKIAIFYKFKQELEVLMKIFGEDLTTDLDVFDASSSLSIALQIVSGREGISLRNAEFLVYYNIDFSALSYWQSRSRTQTKERAKTDIYWVFSEGGIEEKIYSRVQKKKDYTLSHFEKDFSYAGE